MPRTSEKDKVKSWQKKVASAGKAYRKWEDQFRCKQLEEYYEGKQWEEETQDLSQQKYTINLVFPTVEIKVPSLMFYRPMIKIRPKPTRSDDSFSTAEVRAKLQEDTVNTIIQDRRLNFQFETTMALRESFARFGVIEVGYTADIIDNPLLRKPELTDEEKGMTEAAPQIVQDERIFIKRIPADHFRVSVSSKNKLDRNDWCGYYEDHFISDIKANPQYRNTASLKRSGTIDREYGGGEYDPDEMDEEGNAKQRDTIRLWKIWDLRSMTKYVFSENGEKFFKEEPFEYLTFAVFKQYERRTDFYPVPPIFQWLHPQNELNETREMQRVHRRRFYRRYTYLDGAIDKEEIEKLETGGDGVYARANRQDPLQPVPDAPLDMAVVRSIPESKADFREISGVSDEQRGVSDADTTATQANIVDVRSRIRDSYQRQNVAGWLGEIAWLILKTVRDKMALPMWIKLNTDPAGPNAMAEAAGVAEAWKLITAEELGEIEYDVTVDMQSLTPVSNELEAQRWNQVLSLMGNPQMVAVLAGSDVLLRKTLSYYDIRSEKEVVEIKKAMMAIMAMLAAAAAAKAGGGPGGPQEPGPGATPGNEAIAQQIQAQIQ